MSKTVSILIGRSCGHVLQRTTKSPGQAYCFTCSSEVEAEEIDIVADSQQALEFVNLNTEAIVTDSQAGGNGHDKAKAPAVLTAKRRVTSPARDIASDSQKPQPARDLMAKTFPNLHWLVQDLVCEASLTVLAGRAKVGKSWACLQLACAVASGMPFLGKTTARSRVLYCALEDSDRRIQRRLLKQEQMVPDGLDFVYEMPTVSNPVGIAALQLLITTNRYDMLILDTWAAAMGRGVDENDASKMAPIFTALLHLAQVTGCAIVVVSHHGKVASSDAVFDIRGSSAIGGAADTLVGLYKEQGESQGVLALVSRDIEDTELRLSFSTDTCTWSCLGDNRMLAQSENEARALEYLRVHGEADATAVAEELGITRQGASAILKQLLKRALVVSHTENLKAGGREIMYRVAASTEDHSDAVANVATVANSVATIATVASDLPGDDLPIPMDDKAML